MKYRLIFLMLYILVNVLITSAQDGRFYVDCDMCNIIDITEIEADLPSSGSFVKNIHIRHPKGWVISEVDVSAVLRFSDRLYPEPDEIYEIPIEQTVTILSPEVITDEILASYIASEDAPPMFTVIRPFYHINRGCYCGYYAHLNAMKTFVHRFPQLGDYGDDEIQLAILTSDEDWQLNQDMYDAMLKFPSTFEHYLHEDLPYSVFTKWYQIGFPDGWIEFMDDSPNIYFLPEGVKNHNQAIKLEIKSPPISPLRLSQSERIAWAHEFIEEFSILEEYHSFLIDAITIESCHIETSPLRFENSEHYGYFIFAEYTLYTISADSSAEIDDWILDAMAESLHFPNDDVCG